MTWNIGKGYNNDFDAIIGSAKFHHEALASGYVSRKLECIIESYTGRHGKGFKVSYPNYKSTRYKIVQYYIYED